MEKRIKFDELKDYLIARFLESFYETNKIYKIGDWVSEEDMKDREKQKIPNIYLDILSHFMFQMNSDPIKIKIDRLGAEMTLKIDQKLWSDNGKTHK